MTWEVWLVKWKQKRAKKAKEKRFQRKQKEDLKDAVRQIYRKTLTSNSCFVSCRFPETAEKLKSKGFNVAFCIKYAYRYWYTVSWKE